jgi:hypothetical protein
MKSNKIQFIASDDHVYEVRERPYPAAKNIPEWWKEIPKYSNSENVLKLDPKATITVKQCAPVLDMFTSGYIIPLWADILVSQINGEPHVQWATSANVLDSWDSKQSSLFKQPIGFNKTAFKYLHGWKIKTPPGWSSMFIHPASYQDLPIRAIPGIVDTDILDSLINCPFFIKDGFEGVIKKGTPMVQVIPFKRENWISEFSKQESIKSFFDAEKIFLKLYGSYSSIRAKKIFK